MCMQQACMQICIMYVYVECRYVVCVCGCGHAHAHAHVSVCKCVWHVGLEREDPFLQSTTCQVQNVISGQRSLSSALHLYTEACGKGLECYQPFCDHFVSLFANEGSYVSYTQQVFDKMLMWNEGSWNSLITRYAKAGDSKMALLVYHKMRESC